jgi:hypothetical protein
MSLGNLIDRAKSLFRRQKDAGAHDAGRPEAPRAPTPPAGGTPPQRGYTPPGGGVPPDRG